MSASARGDLDLDHTLNALDSLALGAGAIAALAPTFFSTRNFLMVSALLTVTFYDLFAVLVMTRGNTNAHTPCRDNVPTHVPTYARSASSACFSLKERIEMMVSRMSHPHANW